MLKNRSPFAFPILSINNLFTRFLCAESDHKNLIVKCCGGASYFTPLYRSGNQSAMPKCVLKSHQSVCRRSRRPFEFARAAGCTRWPKREALTGGTNHPPTQRASANEMKINFAETLARAAPCFINERQSAGRAAAGAIFAMQLLSNLFANTIIFVLSPCPGALVPCAYKFYHCVRFFGFTF